MGADVALFPEMWNRPHRYGLLTSLKVDEPFIRVDASGETYDRAKR
jgi:hypothetical protein